MNRKHRSLTPWLSIAAALIVLSAMAISAGNRAESKVHGSLVQFHNVPEQTREFLDYYRSISLTPEQEAVMEEALTTIKAPCCSDETAHTCCCECNLAKSWWGLSKHLIADRSFDAARVRTAVTEWLEFINPEGFTGNACYTAQCNRPFHQNGCGGMEVDKLVL